MRASAQSILALLLVLGFLGMTAGPALALDVSVQSVEAAGGAFSDAFREFDGRDVVIAVLDTGVDDEHETFRGAFVTGVDFSSPVLAEDDPACSNPDDRDGHGTHVAGIALGRGAAGSGTNRGVAPAASLVDVKVMTDFGAGLDGLVRGLDWVHRYNAGETTCVAEEAPRIDIVVLALGTPGPGSPDDAFAVAAQRLVDSGVVVVAAAGNCGPGSRLAENLNSPDCTETGPNTVSSPAVARGVIAVAAADDQSTPDRGDDAIAMYSSRGPMDSRNPKPDVTAPGSAITSAQASLVPSRDAAGWTARTGTSMAAPHVAGIAALILQADAALAPAEVKRLLTDGAEDRGGTGWDPEWGHGLASAFQSLALATGRTLNPPAPAFHVKCHYLSCAFDATPTTHPDGRGLTRFAWDFHDGGEDEGRRVTHQYPRAGLWNVTLTVYDSEGRKASLKKPLLVRAPAQDAPVDAPDRAPEAHARVSPPEGPPGTAFHFDASTSVDPEDALRNATWDLDDDGVPDAHGFTFTWSDASPGVHRVTLTVTDAAGNAARDVVTVLVDAGLASDRHVERVDATPPEVRILAPQPGVVLASPLKVRWEATDDGARIARYVVELDGRVVAEPRETMALVRAEPGTHNLTVRAFDAAGNEGVATTTFSVPYPASANAATASDPVRVINVENAARADVQEDAAARADASKDDAARAGTLSAVPAPPLTVALVLAALAAVAVARRRRRA